MNLLGAALYDPASAVSKSTASLIAMTALDTANLRLTVTVPAHGFVHVRMRCAITGATTAPAILLGVMVGAAVKGRVAPKINYMGTAAAASNDFHCDAEFTITGLAAGSTVFDAAYAVQVIVGSTNIKYGGPNDTTGNDAWGAFVFEIWDPMPITTTAGTAANTLPVTSAGQVWADVRQWNDTNVATPATAGIPDVNIKNINNTAAATPGASGGILISGSNAGTTTLGALTITGATTHTGNVVLSDGLTISAPSTLNRGGVTITGNGTGAAVSATGGATGQGFLVAGGGTSGDGIKVTTTSGHGVNLAPAGSSMHGLFATGGNGGTSDGIKAVAGTGGVDIRGNITGNLAGTVSTLTTYTGNTPQTGDSFLIVKSGGAGDNAAIKTQTDKFVFTGAGKVDASVRDWAGDTIPARNTTGVPIVDTKYVTGTLQTARDCGAQLDAAVSSRMASYTQPTGFLASTFPATVASPTNITAGTITTVTNLTNAPTAGDLTAAMKTSVQTATDAAVTANTLVNAIAGYIDTEVAAIKAKTDQLTFTAANKLDCNIRMVNSVAVTGSGTPAAPWGPP